MAAEHCGFSLKGAEGNALIERRSGLMSREGDGRMQKEPGMQLHHPSRHHDVPDGLLSPSHELATRRRLQRKVGAYFARCCVHGGEDKREVGCRLV